MAVLTYTCVSDYIESKTSLRKKIIAIDSLIDSMMLVMADSISGAGANVSEYQLDDGQVKVRTAYRSIDDVQNGIHSLEKLKQMYLNRLNGRNVVLRNEKNLRR